MAAVLVKGPELASERDHYRGYSFYLLFFFFLFPERWRFVFQKRCMGRFPLIPPTFLLSSFFLALRHMDNKLYRTLTSHLKWIYSDSTGEFYFLFFWKDLFNFLHVSNWILASRTTEIQKAIHCTTAERERHSFLFACQIWAISMIDVHICATDPAEFCRKPRCPVAPGLLTRVLSLKERNIGR